MIFVPNQESQIHFECPVSEEMQRCNGRAPTRNRLRNIGLGLRAPGYTLTSEEQDGKRSKASPGARMLTCGLE